MVGSKYDWHSVWHFRNICWVRWSNLCNLWNIWWFLWSTLYYKISNKVISAFHSGVFSCLLAWVVTIVKEFLRKLLCVRHWVPQVICILWGARSLKWLGNTGLTQDPSCDGCACDTKSGVTNMRSTKQFRAAREAFRWDQQVLLSFVVCFCWLTIFSFLTSFIVWLKSCAARLLSGNWQSDPR